MIKGQPALRSWAERLEREAGEEPDKLDVVRDVYAALGDAGSAARSAGARAGSLEKQLEALLARLSALGMQGKRPEGTPTPAALTKLTGTVEQQEKLHREAVSLDGRLAKIGVPAEAWAKPYTEEAVAARRNLAAEQERLHAKVGMLDADAKKVGLPLAPWARPYRAMDVDARAQIVKRQQARAQEAAALDARRAELGLGAAAWALPVTEAALAAAQAELVPWEGWAREVEELRTACRSDLGWSPVPVGPYDAGSVARVRAAVEQQRAWNARVAAVSAVGVSAPVFPHSEQAVAAYERAVASARNVRLAVVALVLAGMAMVGVVTMLAAAKWAEEARIEAERVAEEARIEAERVAEEARLFAEYDAARRTQNWESPSLGMMQWVPAGRFTMGSPESEAGRHSDEVQHEVTLTQGFWMMEHEVTQGEWQAVMGSNPSDFSSCGPTCPVETVSWSEAVEFAQRVSARDGVTYRLPTEAECEYAARGGQSQLYAGSDDVGAVGWYDDNSGRKTHPVCEKQRNAYGLCDMSGNVYEWVSDRYGDYPGGSVTDPQGASSGSLRVERGGGWNDSARLARVALRYGFDPADRDVRLGFRLARTSP